MLDVAATVAAGHESAARAGLGGNRGVELRAVEGKTGGAVQRRAALAGRAAWRDMAEGGGLGVGGEAGPGGAQRGVFSAGDAALMATAGRGEAEDALQRARGKMAGRESSGMEDDSDTRGHDERGQW